MAYVRHHKLAAHDLRGLFGAVYAALGKLGVEPADMPTPIPAVPIKASVRPGHLVCLEDGLRFRSVRRHLMTSYGLTPDDYRRKWGLRQDYPMVAPSYAAS